LKLKNIFVIRHGETDWNKINRFQGQTDIKLNDTGREQALRLRPILQELQIESVYSSPLARAMETIEIATQDLKLTIQKDDRLRETMLGDAEGLTADELLQRFGQDCLAKWRSYDERLLDYHFPNGESKRQLMYRARQVFLDIVQNSNRNNIAVVSHGMLMRAMTYVFGDGVAWEQHAFTNGAIHHYVWSDDSPEILLYKSKIA
jgi:broad specificity phosphatase PhoE